MQKFVKRNKAGVITASLVGVALILGVIGTSWGMWSARVAAANEAEQREIAEKNEQKALQNEQIAHEATEETKRQLEQLKHVAETFAGMLKGISPKSPLPAGTSVYDLLKERVEEMAGQLGADNVGDPLIAAQLQQIMGETLRDLGSHEKALQLLKDVLVIRQKELGENDPETLSTQYHVGSVYCMVGEHAKSLELFKKTLAQREQVLPEGHPDIVRSLKGLAKFHNLIRQDEEALAYLVRIAELYEDHDHDLYSALGLQSMLVTCNHNVFKYDDAKKSAEKFLEIAEKLSLPPDNADLLHVRNVLASIQAHHGELNAGLATMVELHEQKKRRLGVELYYNKSSGYNVLGELYLFAGRVQEAIQLIEESIEVLEASNAPLFKLQRQRLWLARFRKFESRAAADEEARLLQTMRNQHLEANGGDSAAGTSVEQKCILDLIHTYSVIGEHSKSLDLAQSACDELGLNLEADVNFNTAAFASSLAGCYWHAGRFDEAVILRRKILEYHRNNLPDDSHFSLAALGAALNKTQSYEEAEVHLREAWNALKLRYPSLWTPFEIQSKLGEALLGQEKWKEAEPMLLEGFQGMKDREDMIYWNSKNSLEKAAKRLVTLYKGMNNEAEAAKWQQTVDELHKKYPPVSAADDVESAKQSPPEDAGIE